MKEEHIDSAKLLSYGKMVLDIRKVFLTGKTRPLQFRKQQLNRLLAMVDENQDRFYEALEKDLRKPRQETMTSEIYGILREVRHALRHLNSWVKPTAAAKHLSNLFDSFSIHHEPYGVVLIVSPWNYVQLSLSPLVGAIAAGNCAIIKPSELSPFAEALLVDLIPKYLDPECYSVVTGGPSEMRALLNEKFDYIFYTGSFGVAQIVHAAANKYLTPVTLELGGKSPTFVDESVSYRKTAQRILWGKFSNLGQTCIAPDYILCTKAVEIRLVEEIKKVLQEFYGPNPQDSKDLGRIINSRHWNRLRSVLTRTKGDIVIGGELDEYDLWIAPTIIVNVEASDSLMEEELFGPLLPIVTVSSAREAVDFINARGKPLALYVFSTKSDVINLFKKSTYSGGLSINDALYHFSVLTLPFGGVGESGMGNAHGKWSFDTFSYERAVIHRSFEPFGNLHSYVTRHPPYLPAKFFFVKFALRIFDLFYVNFSNMISPVLFMGLGVAFTCLLVYFKIVVI